MQCSAGVSFSFEAQWWRCCQHCRYCPGSRAELFCSGLCLLQRNWLLSMPQPASKGGQDTPCLKSTPHFHLRAKVTPGEGRLEEKSGADNRSSITCLETAPRADDGPALQCPWMRPGADALLKTTPTEEGTELCKLPRCQQQVLGCTSVVLKNCCHSSHLRNLSLQKLDLDPLMLAEDSDFRTTFLSQLLLFAYFI